MKPSISILTLVHAVAAATLLFAGLGPWEITFLVGVASVVSTGVMLSAIGLGAMQNPESAQALVNYLPKLSNDTLAPTAVFYLVLAIASTGWTAAVMGLFAGSSAITLVIRTHKAH